jgi:hypothetical protein
VSDEPRHQATIAAAAFRLVASGKLPPAQGLGVTNGEPLWGLTAISALLGLPIDDLLEHLSSVPARFNSPGKPGLD